MTLGGKLQLELAEMICRRAVQRPLAREHFDMTAAAAFVRSIGVRHLSYENLPRGRPARHEPEID